jgi:hypothetical protein
MRKFTVILLISLLYGHFCVAQDAPNVAGATQLSPNTSAAGKAGAASVNIFTGTPEISLPLYSFSGKGLNYNISADYTGGGGIKSGEKGSFIGIGWYLNATGVITRTVRGLPDDIPNNGFMNAGAIPLDFRSNASKYYYDTIDAQPDIFQFNFNGGSGQFYIGKNKEIVIVPKSNLKIQFTTDTYTHLIIAFKITTENGVKYLFNNPESTKQNIKQGNGFFRSAFTGVQYNSAWYLSQVISPFNTDTIFFHYNSRILNTDFSYPEVGFYKTSDQSRKELLSATGTNTSAILKLDNVVLPNKIKINFDYGNSYRYDDTDAALTNIRIADTIFRKGYSFSYLTSYTGPIYRPPAVVTEDDDIYFDTIQTNYATNLLLQAITPYTATERNKGYRFEYNIPFPIYSGLKGDSVLSAYDHWGYFNGIRNNTVAIPYMFGVTDEGANRYSNHNAIENSLAYVYYPEGGDTHYEYENNYTYPASMDPHVISVNNSTATSTNNITFFQQYSPWHQLTFSLAASVNRTGPPPLSGTCNLVCNVKSTDGTTLYASDTFSLYNLFYQGLQTWTFTVANGAYRLETKLSGGGSITGAFPFSVLWENKVMSTYTVDRMISGGIRVSAITNETGGSANQKAVQEYKYVRDDDTSSGFLGDIPDYYYPFTETITSTSTTTELNAACSDPVSTMNFAQGSPVGYSRVVVYNGTSTKNLGKTVYEFTTLADVGANYFHEAFPYVPEDIKDWGLGLPKRVLMYDSSGNLVEKTTNQYVYYDTTYSTDNFKGLKLGCTATTYAQDPDTYPNTSRASTFVGQEFYIAGGWVALSGSTDTTYHPDGSIQTGFKNYTYDAYCHVNKVTTSYDRNRSLDLETRIYYPYNYSLSSGSIKTLKDSGILSVPVSTEQWITGDSNPRMIGASITDFQTLSSHYIVPSAVYKLQSNKPVLQSTIGVFNPSSLVRNTTYFIQQSAFSQYDDKGNSLEVTVPGTTKNASVIYDYNNQYPVAKISNAAYSDVAYTSFESDGAGNWTIGSSNRMKNAAVTGKQSYGLSNGNITKTGLQGALSYIVSFWLKSGTGSVTVNSASATSISTHNNWTFYTITVSGVTTVTVSGSGQIDELRLMPQDANMVTYTYEPTVGVTSACDANNTIVYSEYDNLGRIKVLRDNDNNIIKKYDYTDSVFAIDTTANWVGIGRACELGIESKYDSVYIDQNPYSATYQESDSILKGYDYCGCTTSPCSIYYKLIGTTCTEGKRYNTSTTENSDGTWTCHFYVKWSDDTQSNYTEINAYGCPLNDNPITPICTVN